MFHYSFLVIASVSWENRLKNKSCLPKQSPLSGQAKTVKNLAEI